MISYSAVEAHCLHRHEQYRGKPYGPDSNYPAWSRKILRAAVRVLARKNLGQYQDMGGLKKEVLRETKQACKSILGTLLTMLLSAIISKLVEYLIEKLLDEWTAESAFSATAKNNIVAYWLDGVEELER